MKRFKIGALYCLKFNDHFIGNTDDEMECSVVGWVVSVGKKYVRLDYWRTYSKLKDKVVEENNRESMKILKGDITEAKEIVL